MASTSVSASTSFDRKAAVDRVLKLMEIPGKSCEEGRVVEFIRGELLAAGYQPDQITNDDVHKESPAGGEVGNLILTLPGTLRAPRRLLMAHLDTVPLCVGSKPALKGGIVRSRDKKTALGADDRSGAAVLLTAALEIAKQKLPHPPLTFFWPVQEEIGLYGARFVNLKKLGNPKLGFNWDGGSAAMACIGATGAYDLAIEIEGLASHAGVHPEAGISAIAIAALAIADLQKNGWHGLIRKGTQSGTSNLGVIQGGDATNVVTASVKLRGEVRSHDPKFRKQLVKEFQEAFERAVAAVKNSSGKIGKVRFTANLKYESFQLKETEACVTSALSAISAVGLKGETRISNGGLDANWLSARGLPTVTLGSG
ncbi:MAG: M20/M25/M40 family metallo-hydrolase, partial [Planctomycetota bacterium]|nr:M20/M25/M40 family metallo-hydrolase [Planctomycetota bacterium]